jgi:hypothetical protein
MEAGGMIQIGSFKNPSCGPAQQAAGHIFAGLEKIMLARFGWCDSLPEVMEE